MTASRRRWLGAAAAAVGALSGGCAATGGASTGPGRDVTRAGGPGRLLDVGPAIDWSPLPPRRVRVWRPDVPAGTRLGVLVMHDGQNLFDPADSIAHGAWDVDRTLARLVAAQRVPPTLVVAVDNAREDRSLEYGPQAPLMTLPAGLRARVPRPGREGATDPRSDAYVDALVQRLLPWVEARFPTRQGPASTAIAGSSMGGLVSLYALCRYPQVFGAAACLSTHWPVTTNAALLAPAPAPEVAVIARSLRDWLAAHLPAPGRHRLWFDHGTEALDALYPPHQVAVDAVLRRAGWTEGRDWITRVYPGTDHNERVWRERLADPLGFVLSARPAA
jgi:enterochelin esterase-like enzyme